MAPFSGTTIKYLDANRGDGKNATAVTKDALSSLQYPKHDKHVLLAAEILKEHFTKAFVKMNPKTANAKRSDAGYGDATPEQRGGYEPEVVRRIIDLAEYWPVQSFTLEKPPSHDKEEDIDEDYFAVYCDHEPLKLRIRWIFEPPNRHIDPLPKRLRTRYVTEPQSREIRLYGRARTLEALDIDVMPLNTKLTRTPTKTDIHVERDHSEEFADVAETIIDLEGLQAANPLPKGRWFYVTVVHREFPIYIEFSLVLELIRRPLVDFRRLCIDTTASRTGYGTTWPMQSMMA